MAAGDLAQAILATSQRIGANPRDLAAAISYETAGTFDPWKAGPTTQWGQHHGLIQWGEPQAKAYGVNQATPVPQQMEAVGQYLQKAGFKPGMGILDLYSAINAGRVGRYGASDAKNGGAPGTVADKVNNQFAGHFANADKLLGGSMQAAAPSRGGPAPTGQAPQAGTQLAAALPGVTLPTGAMTLPPPVFAAPQVGPDQAAMMGQQAQQAEATREQTRKAALFGGRKSLGALFA